MRKKIRILRSGTAPGETVIKTIQNNFQVFGYKQKYYIKKVNDPFYGKT